MTEPPKRPPSPPQRQKPPLLPEENAKRDTQPLRPVQTSRRGSYVIMLLLALIALSLAFFGVAGVILYRPGLVGLESTANVAQTEISFEGTRMALGATADALGATAQFSADVAFSNESTRAALDNRQMMLEQAETQSVLDAQATQTAVAIANAQQATRAAVDFQSTQAAFQQAATQAELAYQGTQAALRQEATAVALGFATDAPSAQDILTQTPPPTLTAVPLFRDGFESGLQTQLWDFSAPQDWTLSRNGTLVAERSGAWLLTQMNDLREYAFEVALQPLQGAQFAADYHLLLNVNAAPQSPNGLAVRISYDGSRVTAVGLHLFSLADLYSGDGLLNRPLTAVQAQQVNLPPDTTIRARAELRGQRLIVVVNERLALDVALEMQPQPGAVGLQVPRGAGITRVTLLP